jgi:hypothetical protein
MLSLPLASFCCCCRCCRRLKPLTTAAAAAATAQGGACRHYFDERVQMHRKSRAFACRVCVGYALENNRQTFGKAPHAHSISALLILGANITAALVCQMYSLHIIMRMHPSLQQALAMLVYDTTLSSSSCSKIFYIFT